MASCEKCGKNTHHEYDLKGRKKVSVPLCNKHAPKECFVRECTEKVLDYYYCTDGALIALCAQHAERCIVKVTTRDDYDKEEE